MSVAINVPPFPESVEEGTLTTWYKQAGDTVARDEKIADIETDKIVLDLNAPEAGTLADVQVEAGATVKPGQRLATITPGAAGKGKQAKQPDPADRQEAPAAEPDAKTEAQSKTEREPETAADDGPAPHLSPAARRLAEQHGVDAARVTGTGRHGVVTKADVAQYVDGRKDAPVKSATAGDRPEQRVPMTRIRARIAERLLEAQQTAALLTTFNEVNMQPVIDLRNRYKADFEKTHGVKLGFMSFFVKAAVAALKQFPVVNATLDGGDIVYHGYYDVGVAVSTARGLVVPVLRNADRHSYAEIERAVAGFAQRARNGQLAMEDLTGGTFSITNGGIFGSLLSTPIVNPPQSAILGMHQIQPRPVAEDGRVVIRPMMYLALTYDHRLVDGRDAVQFLVALKEHLEFPARSLLGV
jgi:2-oxoglutarate dehydrogenase E2 component (dihydrolipoamide succinyltransferase)